MSIRVTRDGDDVVVRIKAGREVNSFARFLETAASAIEVGKILPTNPNPTNTPGQAADMIRELAGQVREMNC